jgi:hypothetical protein
MAVLAYYRCEWTDISDNDFEYKLKLTEDLNELIRKCCVDKMNVPNAAKEIKIFLDTTKQPRSKS